MDSYHQTIGHRGLPALLLSQGVWFHGRGGSNDYQSTRRWRKTNRPKAQDCFYNAQSFCMDCDEAAYFEGYVLCLPTLDPAEHAWFAMPDGKVVDFTLEAMERVANQEGVPCDTRKALYVGLGVPTAFIRETVAATGWHDSLAEEYLACQIGP
jgi:hypothetical protein